MTQCVDMHEDKNSETSYMTTLANATPERNFGLGPDDDVEVKSEARSADSSVMFVTTNKPFPTTPVASGLAVVGMPPESYNVATQQEQIDPTLLNDRFSIRSHEILHTNPSSMVMEDRALLQVANKKSSMVGGSHINALRKAKKSTDDALKAQRLNQQIHATKIAEKNAREVTPYHTPHASLTSQQNDSPGFSNLQNAVTSPPALSKKIYNNGLNPDYFREQPQP